MSMPSYGSPRPGDPRSGSAGGAQYYIPEQHAARIDNVARDQYNSYIAYVTHVQQQRESFGREIAAAKSKARALSRVGGVLAVIGFGAWAYVIVSFADRIPGFDMDTSPGELFGPVLFGGVRLGMLALATMVVGMVLLVVGIILHISSTARRRRVDRDYPIPPPAGVYPRYAGR